MKKKIIIIIFIILFLICSILFFIINSPTEENIVKGDIIEEKENVDKRNFYTKNTTGTRRDPELDAAVETIRQYGLNYEED